MVVSSCGRSVAPRRGGPFADGAALKTAHGRVDVHAATVACSGVGTARRSALATQALGQRYRSGEIARVAIRFRVEIVRDGAVRRRQYVVLTDASPSHDL